MIAGHGCRRWCRGFTLVELLISITLLSIAMALLLGGFRFTTRAWDSGDRVTRRTADLEIVHRVIGNMIDRLHPTSLADEASEGYAFLGTSRRIRFPAYLPPYPASGGLYTVEFLVTRSNEQDQLWMKLAPFDDIGFQADELQVDEETLLLETSLSLSFSYFNHAVGAEWQTQWESETDLPQVVRLRFGEGDAGWPDVIRPIRVNMDGPCFIPELNGYCRLDN